MKIIDEFKAFAIKGNVIDLAIGITIGTAFGKIITSIVADIVMPPFGWLIGGVDFKDLKIVLKDSVGKVPAISINYGNFLQVALDFIIVAVSIFLIIKAINVARRKQEAAAPPPTTEEILLTEIRDLLRK